MPIETPREFRYPNIDVCRNNRSGQLPERLIQVVPGVIK